MIILDWYHLEKKCKEELSRAMKGREIRNKVLKRLTYLLWYGLVDHAIEALKNLDSDLIKNPEAIEKLPLADIPLNGLKAHLSQGPKHQILFMEFDEDVELDEHSHEAQYGIILEGRIDLCIDGENKKR